jgi:S-adenosylmethionine hydrolase
MPARIITLTTDFGTRDPYVAELKGVILSRNPAVHIVDVSHDINAQDVREAALCVAAVFRHFPAGTIHVVVVDPGVGSSRRLLCVTMHEQLFLGPDNGVLTWAARGAANITRIVLTDPRFWRENPSATFHGRDILAPVAAQLSLGLAPVELGSPTREWVELDWPCPERRGTHLCGEVLAIDRFGNLITNIESSEFALALRPTAQVICREAMVRGISRTYADVGQGELAALFGSSNLLEIAVRDGNAAAQIGANIGCAVMLQFEHIGNSTVRESAL